MDPPAVRVGSPMPITPKSQRRNVYKDLLSAFGSQSSPTSVSQARKSSVNPAPAQPTMPSTSPDPISVLQPLANPEVVVPVRTTSTELLDDSSKDEEETPKRNLRPRATRPTPSYSTRTTPRTSTRRESKRLLRSDMADDKETPTPTQRRSATTRMKVRSDIAQHTKVKRDAFLYRHCEYFLPLLPAANYISKLGRQSHAASMTYVELDTAPKGVTATLKPYQLSGLSFMAHMNDNGMPCMLGDEMGLGKTLQTLSLFQLLEEKQTTRSAENRPYLVVCPLSVVNSWVTEAHRWTPGLKFLRFHGPKAERDSLKKVATGHHDRYGNETVRSKKRTGDRRRASNRIVANLDLDGDVDDETYKLIITSYETFVSEHSWFKTAFVWRYIVLDEGHRVKNSNTNVSQALQNLRAEYRMILTGTPLQNDLLEMWSLLHWLLPDVFTEKTADLFKTSFDLSKGQVNTSVMNSARQLLELLMLRRMKNSPGVDLNLPPKEEVLLYVPLTPLQRFWYLRLLTRSGDALLEDIFSDVKDKEKDALRQDIEEHQKIKELEQVEANVGTDVWAQTREMMKQSLESEKQEQKKSDWTRLMNLVMQLRKCCSHPYLLPGVQPDPYSLGDHVVRASGKFIVLEKLLKDLIVTRGKKVIIFSGFTSTLDLCEDLMAMISGDGEAFRYLRFDGSTERARRNLDIRLFNEKSSDYMAMLISTRAGGLGINLTAATEAIFLDEDWNPQITLQAEARAHRIGQTKPVTIYKLCTQGTVEAQMMGRIRKKLYLSAKITESMKSVHGTPLKKKKGRASNDDDKPHLDTSELRTLVRRGAQTLAHAEIDVTDMLSWDLETVLDKCRDKPSDPQVGDDHTVDEEKWLSSMERVETAVFDGRRFQRNLDEGKEVQLDLIRHDRRKGKNTTVMVDGFAINKESMNCEDWEAVPTLAGKDPRLAEPVRQKKKAIVNQDHCQVCWDGGELLLCSLCPRSYHEDCLTEEQRSAVSVSGFHCPQHICTDCSKKTTEAGGMLLRCRFCPAAFCEDCCDFNRTSLIGGTLPELQLLDFGEIRQAFFVKCHQCVDLHAAEPEMKEFSEEQAQEFDRLWEEAKAKVNKEATVTAANGGKDTKPSNYQPSLADGFHGLPSTLPRSPGRLTIPYPTRASPLGTKTANREILSLPGSRASSSYSLDLTDATTTSTTTGLSTPRDGPIANGYFGSKATTGQLRFGAPVLSRKAQKAAAAGLCKKRRAANESEEEEKEEVVVADGVGGLTLERRPKKQQRPR